MERILGTPPVAGREAIRQTYAQQLAAMAGMSVEGVRTFITGNGAAAYLRAEVTAKSGRAIQMEGINTYEFNEAGQIQMIRFYNERTAAAALLQR